MEIPDNFMSVLGTVSVASVSMTYVLKKYLGTAIEKSVASVYERQLENHKFLLKNSEKVFEYKLNATKVLYKILNDMVPKKTHPEMGWDEACDGIAESFEKHEDVLGNFLCDYQATLSTESLDKVKRAINLCSQGKFSFKWDGDMERELPTYSSLDNANKLFDVLNETVEILRNEVHDLISIPDQ